MIADSHNVNRVLKKVEYKESGIIYGHVGQKEELMILGIDDASFKMDEKAVGGIILFFVNKEMTRTSPIHCKSKQIERVCYLSKDAKTLILN